jgi:hypothetical protein
VADSVTSPRNWFKYGCLGVLGLAGLVLLWVGSIFGTAYWRGRTEVVERQELSRGIPAPTGSHLQGGRLGGAGRVVLDFTVGEFEIVRGKPGEPVLVDAEFDGRSYELRESFVQPEGTGWTYRLTFVETSWFKDGGLRAVLGGSFPKIRVSLPPDVPLALVARFGKGAARADLGGLWLTDVDLEFEKGALEVDFDRPLAAPAERVAVRARQGGLFVGSLGNASPRELEIDHRMGGMTVDLRGKWVRDAEVRIASLMGGGQIFLPRGVKIEGLAGDGSLAPRRRTEVAPPTLRMSVSSRLGGLNIVE